MAMIDYDAIFKRNKHTFSDARIFFLRMVK